MKTLWIIFSALAAIFLLVTGLYHYFKHDYAHAVANFVLAMMNTGGFDGSDKV